MSKFRNSCFPRPFRPGVGVFPAVHRLEARELLTAQPISVDLARSSANFGKLSDVRAELKATSLAVLTTNDLPEAFYDRTAAAVQAGRMSMARANLRILRQSTARSVIAQGLWTKVFKSEPTLSQLKPYVTGRNAQAGMRCLLIQMAASPVYFEATGGNPADYRAAVSELFLGGQALPPRLANAPVGKTGQRVVLLEQMTNLPDFKKTWVSILADVASNSGSFTPEQLQKASRTFLQPYGMERTLSHLLTLPASKADVARRVEPVVPTTGSAIDNVWALHQGWLFTEPTFFTSVAAAADASSYSAAVATTAAASGGSTVAVDDANLIIPQGSEWGDRIGFPGVSYDAIMAGTSTSPATVPTLNLPTSIVTGADLDNGLSVAFWVQARGPGLLLGANYGVTGSLSQSSINVPYIWINSDGNLVAGLYGSTSLSVNAGQTILGMTSPLGESVIGSPLAITSQINVIDNTWHHIAFTADSDSQSLYVDGLLQGTNVAADQQMFTNQSTNSANQVVLTLATTPLPGSQFNAQVSQFQRSTETGTLQAGFLSYTLSGPVQANGSSPLKATTAAANSSGQNVDQTELQSAVLNGNTLTLTFAQPITNVGSDENFVDVAVQYPSSTSSFSQTPTVSNLTLGGVSSLVSGTTIFSTSASAPVPQINYPQSFIGAMDEFVVWNAAIPQSEVQAFMTQPTPATDTVAGWSQPEFYFNFDATGAQTTFVSQSPATNTTAVATATGLITGIGATIPTDPFAGVERLPGYRNYGIQIMTPLTASSVAVPGSSGTTSSSKVFKVGLAAGDQFRLSLSGNPSGSLSFSATNDLAQSLVNQYAITTDNPAYFVATRTGTYQFTLNWTGSEAVSVGYALLPGPLNNLPVLTTSYAIPGDEVVFAYADPTLPTINPTVGTSSATGPANYFPLWTDTTWFPNTSDYTPAQLNAAYMKLVASLVTQQNDLNDFCDIVGSDSTPSQINSFLNAAYTANYGTPPAPPSAFDFSGAPASVDFFDLSTPTTAPEAVYAFLYNTNLLRQTVFVAYVGAGDSISNWIQSVINEITASTSTTTVATTISEGQTAQETGVTINSPSTAAAAQPKKSIWVTALSTVGHGIEDLVSDEVFEEDPVAAAGLRLGFAAMNQSLVAANDSAATGNASNQSIFVPYTPLTNAMLNYESLAELATNIQGSYEQQWNSIQAGITSPLNLSAIGSNFGLLIAIGNMSGTVLSDPALVVDQNSIDENLTDTAWSVMIPATFQWQQVPAYGIPTYDMASGSYNPINVTVTGANASNPAGLATADFNNDGIPDIAIANMASANFTVMLGVNAPVQTYGQNVSYPPQNMASYGPISVCVDLAPGDFDADGDQDLVLIGINNEAYIYLNDGAGAFTYLMTVNLAGSKGPVEILTSDFNDDGYMDFALTGLYNNYSTVCVSINTTANPSISPAFADWAFSTETSSATGPSGNTISFLSYSLNLGGGYAPDGIATGNFQSQTTMPDLAIINTSSNSLGLLINLGKSGSTWNGFAQTLNVGLSGITPTGDLTVGDFDGSGIADDVLLLGSYDNDNKPVPSSLGGFGPNYSAGNSLWLLTGNGRATSTSSGFSTPLWIGVVGSGGARIATIPGSMFGQSQDGAAIISPDYDENTVYNTQNVYLVYDVQQTRSQFVAALNPNGNDWIPLNAGPQGVVMYQVSASDVPNNGTVGSNDIAIASNGMLVNVLQVANSDGTQLTSQIAYTGNAMINTLPFQFGQSTQTSLLNLSGSVDTGYIGKLQGGQPVIFPSTSAISQNVDPSIPGSTNLVVPPAVISPGLFLSWTPAQVTGLNGSSGQQLGGLLTGWNLVDSNGNPIALSTLQALVGTAGPVMDGSGNPLPAINPYFWNSATITPVQADSPVVAFNGGWFYLNQPIDDAITTWADAFFNWGLGTDGYSPHNLVPVSTTVPIPGGSSTSWTIAYSAATTAPPRSTTSGVTTAQATASPATSAVSTMAGMASKNPATAGKPYPNGKLRASLASRRTKSPG